MNQIVQLVRKNKNRLELCQEGVEALNEIDDLISTCICVGPYRQGKSFLLNKIMSMTSGQSRTEFEIGHTDRSCTKGIWMTAKPIDVVNHNNQVIKVLFFDTEVID
jgi:hypothetical protein